MQLIVRPTGQIFPVQPGLNLLDTLLQHNVPISYSCRDGRCGMCRCTVVLGKVIESGRHARGVPGAAHGCVLACQSVLSEDCGIEIPEPEAPVVHPARLFRAQVVAVERLARDVVRVRLLPPRPLAFSPGQFVEVEFEKGFSRPYSMCSTAADRELVFHIKLHLEGRASRHIGEVLKPGDSVKVRGPLGTAFFRHRGAEPLLCVAAGTGLAPLLSVLRGFIAEKKSQPIHVCLGFSSAADIYGLDELNELLRSLPSARLHLAVASGMPARGMRRGLLTDLIRARGEDLSGWRSYIFGAPHAVEAAARLLRQKGMCNERIHAEPFHSQGT